MYICKIFTNLNVKEYYFYNIMQDRCNCLRKFFSPYIIIYFYIYINFVDLSVDLIKARRYIYSSLFSKVMTSTFVIFFGSGVPVSSISTF